MSIEQGAVSGAYPKNLNRPIHGLRGFAALIVFIFHIYGMSSILGFWPAALDPFDDIFIAGRHGVELFFIISGYLITGSLIRHGSARKFLIDRAIRIYPVFMAIQLLVFCFGPPLHYKWLDGLSLTGWLTAFVSNGLFLPGLFDLPLAQLNAWSLSYEAAFYLLSAAIFCMARLTGRAVAFVLLVIIVTPLFIVYPKSLFFGVGVIVFFINRGQILRPPPRLRAFTLPAFIVTLVLLTMAETSPALIFIAPFPAFVFFWPAIEGRDALSAFLERPFLQYMGTISYSFYLWSPVVTYPIKLSIEKFLHGWISDWANVGLFAVTGFVASVAVAHISYRLLEGYAGRALHRINFVRRSSG